jgi:hypothetical protein
MQKPAPTMDGVTREMYKRAIVASAPQLGLKHPAEVLEILHRGECDQCKILRIHLAHQVAEFLARVDSDLRAVYSYNPEYAAGNYDDTLFAAPDLSSAIYLLAWTRNKKTAPIGVLEGLTDAFDKARTKVVCPNATALCFSLDVKVVGDTQVGGRKGYAVMIDSLNARPNQVWPKDHVNTRKKTHARELSRPP